MPRRELVDAVRWLGLVVLGAAVTLLLVRTHQHIGTHAAPFTGSYRLRLVAGSVLAPAVAVAVLAAVRLGWAQRLPWPGLLAASWLAALAWAVALAFVDGGSGLSAPLGRPAEYLRDLPAVGHPVDFLRHFVALTPRLGIASRQHPPGALLLLWGAHRIGLTRPGPLGVVVTAVGSATVPLVAHSTRSLCGEETARRLLPLLVLAPWAVWVAVSLDGVTAAVCAAFVTCGVLASERGRSWLWAALAGLLLGVAAMLSYSAGWVGLTLVAVYFLRRRPFLNLVTGAGALVPLGLCRAAGFIWPDGLTAAQHDFTVRLGSTRSWLVWIPLSLLLLVIASGPGITSAARKVRSTPGWPFLTGAGVAIVFALVSGLSRGEVERSWLPFFPWLLVPAVAPDRPGGPAPPPPLWSAALGALTGIVVQAVLLSPW